MNLPYGGAALEAFLLGAFRYRTRGFLKMEEDPGAVPPPPLNGADYLYLHVPFCPVLCPFCSFHRVLHHPALAGRYFQALREEVRMYHRAGYRFNGAYFGGGTPTSEPEELAETVRLVRDLFGVSEISVETNPRDLRPEVLEPLRASGVTRLSVGVQSFDDDVLRSLGRIETYGGGSEIQEAIGRTAGLFPTLNIDLIFNQPRQTLDGLKRDLAAVLASGANQVSLYPLMTSPSTRREMAATTGLPGRGRYGRYYRTILETLQPAFHPSSAWCFNRGGRGTDEYVIAADHYVGVGSGAFSYLDGTLYATSFSLQAYERRIAEGMTGIVSRHRLSETDQMRYTLLLRLFGLWLDREWVLQRHGPRFFRRLWGEMRTLEWLGAVERNERGWKPTDRGMYWLVLMMAAFYESVNGYREAMRVHVREELHQSQSEFTAKSA